MRGWRARRAGRGPGSGPPADGRPLHAAHRAAVRHDLRGPCWRDEPARVAANQHAPGYLGRVARVMARRGARRAADGLQQTDTPQLARQPAALDLLGQVMRVDFAQLAGTQQAGLLRRPGEEVLIVGDGVARHRPVLGQTAGSLYFSGRRPRAHTGPCRPVRRVLFSATHSRHLTN